MHYYQFNIADYRKDTTHLSMLEHGAYRQLLDWHYLEQAPIPLETEVVFRRLSARTNEERLAIEIVLKEMFVRTDEGYIQHRVMQEIDQYSAKADRARDNGKLGGRPKKTKEVISGNLEGTQEKANSLTYKPINSLKNTKNKPSTSAKLTYEDVPEFLQFWSAYPRKDDKKKSFDAWVKHKPPIDKVLSALDWQSKSQQWLKNEGQFIPLGETYINGARWEAEPTKITATPRGKMDISGIDYKAGVNDDGSF
jgi:uncharacterized protein YdaU (DUF1376 family)